MKYFGIINPNLRYLLYNFKEWRNLNIELSCKIFCSPFINLHDPQIQVHNILIAMHWLLWNAAKKIMNNLIHLSLKPHTGKKLWIKAIVQPSIGSLTLDYTFIHNFVYCLHFSPSVVLYLGSNQITSSPQIEEVLIFFKSSLCSP